MSFKYSIGASIEIPGNLLFSKKLFSETGGFVLEIRREFLPAVQACFAAYTLPCFILGQTQAHPFLEIKPSINLAIADAKKQWQDGLREKLC